MCLEQGLVFRKHTARSSSLFLAISAIFRCIFLHITPIFVHYRDFRILREKPSVNMICRGFPGGPVADAVLPIQGAGGPPLVRELDPTCCS